MQASAIPQLDLDYLRKRKRDSTQRLLGETIAISDDDWQYGSSLPGWTRAHVATHISRRADAIRRLLTDVAAGSPSPTFAPGKIMDIERGSERSALDLQIDLDTSAGQLNTAFDALSDARWESSVVMADGFSVPCTLLPLMRLAEVELHRVDLNFQYRLENIDAEVASWMLAWFGLRISASAQKNNYVLLPHGMEPIVVNDGSGPEVSGSVHALLGWITGRDRTARVQGAAPRDMLL